MTLQANEQDIGPFRVDLLLAVWWRLERALDALHAVGFIDRGAADFHATLTSYAASGRETVNDARLTKALRLLAQLHDDGRMHAGDWLRMKAVEASSPRKKPPASVDLQIRLRGLHCTRLVAQVVRRKTEGTDEIVESHRVTIRNVRGDVASCESESFAAALDGAITMAGARREGTE